MMGGRGVGDSIYDYHETLCPLYICACMHMCWYVCNFTVTELALNAYLSLSFPRGTICLWWCVYVCLFYSVV